MMAILVLLLLAVQKFQMMFSLTLGQQHQETLQDQQTSNSDF